MSVDIAQENEGRVLLVHASGKLTREDYKALGPQVEELIGRCGKLRILFDMHDFHGWKAGALWEDIKFDFKHFRDIERLAIVGESRWQKGMSFVCKPFTAAKIRFFPAGEQAQARSWLEGP